MGGGGVRSTVWLYFTPLWHSLFSTFVSETHRKPPKGSGTSWGSFPIFHHVFIVWLPQQWKMQTKKMCLPSHLVEVIELHWCCFSQLLLLLFGPQSPLPIWEEIWTCVWIVFLKNSLKTKSIEAAFFPTFERKFFMRMLEHFFLSEFVPNNFWQCFPHD